MEAAENGRRALGELLLAKGLVTEDELKLALSEQERSGRFLGAILVERRIVSGPALATALAEQHGVELSTQQGFGTGLWAEIERRHRAGRADVVRLPAPPLEAVPDPDPELDRLRAENDRLQAELERLRTESSLRLVPEAELPSSHLVFVPTPQSYRLLEREGPSPEPGDELELDEGSFVVGKVGRAPFPGERRPCAFLLRR